MSRRQRKKDVAQDHGSKGSKRRHKDALSGRGPLSGAVLSSYNKRRDRRLRRIAAKLELRDATNA